MSNPERPHELTPLEVARRLESQFFGADGFNPQRAVGLIRAEAEACGIPLQVAEEVHDSGGWWLIAADDDWLPKEDEGIRAFERLLHLPEAGQNANRNEIFLTVFARTVLTSLNGSIVVIVDRADAAEEGRANLADVFQRWTRAIAFLP